MEQGSEPLLFDGNTHTPLLPVRPRCPEATRQHPPAFLEPGAPQTLHKVLLLLGNIHRYPGISPVPLWGETQPREGAETHHTHPSLRAGRRPRLRQPRAAPGCFGEGAQGRRLAPHPHQQPPASARPTCSGEAELRGVCPAPAQGTELAIPSRTGPFQGGFPGIQPPANPADEHAEDGGAEDDEDPGVHDGVHGEKPQGAEVSVLVEIGGKGPHVRPDLSKK